MSTLEFTLVLALKQEQMKSVDGAHDCQGMISILLSQFVLSMARAHMRLRRGAVGRDLRGGSRMVVPGFNYSLTLATAKFRINRAALSAANQSFTFYETIVHQYGHKPG